MVNAARGLWRCHLDDHWMNWMLGSRRPLSLTYWHGSFPRPSANFTHSRHLTHQLGSTIASNPCSIEKRGMQVFSCTMYVLEDDICLQSHPSLLISCCKPTERARDNNELISKSTLSFVAEPKTSLGAVPTTRPSRYRTVRHGPASFKKMPESHG